MSSKNISEDKKLQNPKIFLGKKSEIIEKCKSCRKNVNLIKCVKCSNYYCIDCIKNIFKLTLSGIKSEQFICPTCEIKCEDNNKLNNCFICKKLLNENNFTCFYVTKEQIIKINNELNELNKDKTISLIEEENNNIENKNLSQKSMIKVCNKCTTNYEYLIGKYFLLKNEKEENNKQNILDELTNIIMKEKGNENINIFDILENKSEKSEDSSNDNKLNVKKKTKDLFESMVVERKEKTNFEIKNKKEEINKDKNKSNKSYQNALINNNIQKINKQEQNIPSININSNNKTSNIYLPNFFTITQLNNNHIPNNQNINQKISKSPTSQNLSNVPGFYNNINPMNDIYLKNNIKPNNNIIKNTNDIQSQIPNLLLNNNNIYNNTKLSKSQILEDNKNLMTLIKQNNILNTNNENNKLNNCSQNLKDINEGINNLININDSNNNINNLELKKNISTTILNTLDKISKCLYNFDNNNMDINIDIINKIESLSNFYYNISQNEEQKNEDEKNKETQKGIKIDKEMNESIISLIDSIKNELNTLRILTEIKKAFLSIIYQNIDIYLKEINKVENNKNINQIQQQPNINNIMPQIYPINSLNNLQGINLLNNNNIPNLDINAFSNNLNNPLPQILTNNNISNYFPLLSMPISLPNVLNQAKINSLGNSLFQQ